MTTVVNTPQAQEAQNPMWNFLGILLVGLLVIVLLFYGIPMIRSAVSGPQITVPDKIDINVNK